MAMAENRLLITVVAILASFQCCFSSSCVTFDEEGVTSQGKNRTLTFSLLTKKCNHTEDGLLASLTVDVKKPGGNSDHFLICNLFTTTGACVPSGACSCGGDKRYVVRRQVEEPAEDELWHLTATFRNGRVVSHSVNIPGVTFDEEGVTSQGKNRTLTFSLYTKKGKNSEEGLLKRLTVDVKKPGGNSDHFLICNLFTTTGSCVPSGACSCSGDTRYVVTRQVEEPAEDELWQLTATFRNGREVSHCINIPAIPGKETATESFFQTPTFGVVMSGAIAGVLLLVVVVWRCKRRAPQGGKRISQRYDCAYEMRTVPDPDLPSEAYNSYPPTAPYYHDMAGEVAPVAALRRVVLPPPPEESPEEFYENY